MPSVFSLRHSNRSQGQQLDSPQAQRPPSGHLQPPVSGPAPEDKGYDPRIQPQSYPETHNDFDHQRLHSPIHSPIEASSGSSPFASADTQHYSKFPPPPQFQQQQQQGFGHSPSNSNELSQAPGIPGRSEKRQTASVSNTVESPVEPAKKSKSRFFAGFTSKSQKAQQPPPQTQQGHHHGFSLGRSISKKQSSKPELRMQQNQSIERLQQGWHQSQGSSSGTLPSQSEHDKDEFDPFQIREDETHEPLQQHYDPRQGLSVRVVDDSQPQNPQFQQYQDQQHLQSPSQYSPQQYQQFSQHTTPISPEPNSEYNNPQPMPLQQPGQYQQQNPNFSLPSSAYRQNAEVISQISHESPMEAGEDRPPSVHSTQGYQQYPSRKASVAGSGPPPPPPLQQQQQQQQGSMAPPPQSSGSQHQGRKSTEVNKNLQPGDARGQPPAYNQGQLSPPSGQAQPVNLQSPLPPIPGQVAPPGYRNSQLRSEVSAASEGRSTPPLPAALQENRDLTELDKLILKYKKVKGLYFEKQAQVEALQNTLANQRLSQSRTSLDDNEYATRFQRLDSAIKEIAFGVRKDWSSLPEWLSSVVNADAMKIGTKEMTAVGRAVICRWIVDEIWGKCFHPGLEPPLREELKRMEMNIRHYSPPPGTPEDQEAQTAKIVQWRLATMEGLAYRLNGRDAQEAKENYVQICVSNLTAHLLQHLSEAAAMMVQGNATSIVELAVGIASHLPLESRDIIITYPLPKEQLHPNWRVEQGLPPVESFFAEGSEDGNSSKSKDEEEKSDKGKKGKLLAKNGKKGEPSGPTPEQVQEMERKKQDAKGRIRFAGFVDVEVRGRPRPLYDAPVWTIA